MIRKFLLVFMVLIPLSTIAQVSGTKSLEPYYTKSGLKIEVGDTIILGIGSNYDKKFKHVYVPAGLVSNKYVFPKTSSYKRFPVKFFKKQNIGGQIMTYAVIPSKSEVSSFNNAAVEIELALKSGELLLKGSQFLSGKGKFMDAKTALLQYIIISGSELSAFAREYSYRFDNDTFEKYHQDEFEFVDILEKTVNKMSDEISEFKKDNVFRTNATIKFGKYAFEKEAFEFSFDAESVTVLKKAYGAGALSKGLKTHEVNIAFNNKSEIKYFPLNKVIARDFIKERKNKYSGKVDRTVYLRINYILTGLIVERKKKYGVVKKCLEAKIKSVEVYGNKNGYSDDLGVLKL